jgi:outer membrane receptor protein involved in Fe transport
MAAIRSTVLILLLLDGREVNIEFFSNPFYAALPVGLNDIERIEIVLGPGSALYGANAIAAVINVITRQPGTDLGAEVFYASGEHGASIVEGVATGGFGPLAIKGSFGIDRANSWMDRNLLSKNVKRANAVLHLDLPDGGVTANGGVTSGAGRLFSYLGYLDFQDFLFAHLSAKIELGNFKSQLYWYGLRVTANIEIDIVHPEMGITLGTIPGFQLDGDTLQTEAQYEIEPFQNNLLIAGADFRFTSYRSNQIVDPQIEEYRVGVFLHDEHRFGNIVLLTVGARFDLNSVTDPAISPRATLLFCPAANHFLRLSAGAAFRKPTILETSANFKIDADPAFRNEMKILFEERGISNPDLPNEILTSLEVGYRGSFLEKALRLGGDVYFDMRRRWISFATDIRFNEFMQIDLNNSKIGYENIGEDSNIIGVNLQMEGHPFEELTFFLRGDLRYRWELESGEEHEVTPNLVASAGATVRLPFGLTTHSAVVLVSAITKGVRNPESVLAPRIMRTLPAHAYLLCALTHRFPLGHHRAELGLSLFNPFGGRFRETTGVRAPDGSNYGGELLGTRAMLTARLVY